MVAVTCHEALECLGSREKALPVGEVTHLFIHTSCNISVRQGDERMHVCGGNWKKGIHATCSHGDSTQGFWAADLGRPSMGWGGRGQSGDLQPWRRLRVLSRCKIKIWAAGGGIWRWELPTGPATIPWKRYRRFVDECSQMRHIPVWSALFWQCMPIIREAEWLIITASPHWMKRHLVMRLKRELPALCPTINFMPAYILTTFPPKYDKNFLTSIRNRTVC